MTLSEYEKTQFEQLTADFNVEDAGALKEMEKLDKTSALSFVALPGLHNVPLVAAVIALVFMIAGRVTGNDSQMFLAGGISILCIMVSYLVMPKTTATSPESEEEN
jgi:hypothetical protein